MVYYRKTFLVNYLLAFSGRNLVQLLLSFAVISCRRDSGGLVYGLIVYGVPMCHVADVVGAIAGLADELAIGNRVEETQVV